jgi:hypothetical protein
MLHVSSTVAERTKVSRVMHPKIIVIDGAL